MKTFLYLSGDGGRLSTGAEETLRGNYSGLPDRMNGRGDVSEVDKQADQGSITVARVELAKTKETVDYYHFENVPDAANSCGI
jgi:hypothetical protein